MLSLCLALALQDPDEKLRAMQDQIDALQRRLADLEMEIQVMKLEAAEPVAQEERPTPANVFNPQITVFGNMAARLDSRTVRSPEGDQVDDHLFLRGVEVDFRAAVDPYADAVAILAVEQEPDGGFEVDAEEAFAVLKRLPFIEDAPLGMKLKAGKFRPPFGTVNTMHLHDLPWTTRPEPVVEYLGTEHGSFFESGWSDVGGGVSFFLPEALTPEDTAVEFDYYAMDTGGIAIADGNGGTIPGHVARGNLFIRADDENQVNVGTSLYREDGHRGIDLYGLDFMFRHRPDQFESFVLGGELFYGDRKGYADGARVRNTPLGWFVYAQYQFDPPWYVGVRYDVAEDVDDDTLEERVLGAYVSYYTSEFLRLRLGVEHRWSDVFADDGNTVMLELNWVFGSHPVEPYWVNR